MFSTFSTYGVENYKFYVRINDSIIELLISDTPGLERYFQLAFMTCKKQDLFICVYPIDDLNSFNDIQLKIKEIKKKCKKNAHFILVGSKSDLEDKRAISYDEELELADKEKMDLFIEVSAQRNFNIDTLFFEAAKILYKKYNK